jgi:serine/threonine protein kinase
MRSEVRVGQILGGKWRIESLLGSGGTSTVHAVTNVTDGTRAALKLLHASLAQKPSVLKILLAEARLVAAVEHPGTVKVLDDGVVDGCAFLVFELLAGQTLEELRQARGGRIELGDVMRIGDAVMDALSAVHRAGIVHRDLKPANIYVLEGGGVKLLDFGLAKKRGYTAEAAQHIFGTPSFMPPEQALGLTKKMDAQSDVWSLGATLFQVLSGQPVHDANDKMNATLLADASARPRSLATVAPDIDAQVIVVIDRALSYRKADRWPDIRSMRTAWQAAHPSWLPPLPPPAFTADPTFLDASLLVPEPPVKVKPQRHPGPVPTARKKKPPLPR